MAVTWTSGYGIDEAVPVVEWGLEGEEPVFLSPAGTLTFSRNSMCGPPARTVGWRDPGFIHTSILKDLWSNTKYSYKVGHRLYDGSFIWGQEYSFRASPYPGQDSLQRVIILGDMGKAERDESNEYSNYQPGSLNTTDRLVEDLDNIDIVFHIGDLSYANGYLSQWDQFTSQTEPIASSVPYMVARYSPLAMAENELIINSSSHACMLSDYDTGSLAIGALISGTPKRARKFTLKVLPRDKQDSVVVVTDS